MIWKYWWLSIWKHLFLNIVSNQRILSKKKKIHSFARKKDVLGLFSKEPFSLKPFTVSTNQPRFNSFLWIPCLPPRQIHLQSSTAVGEWLLLPTSTGFAASSIAGLHAALCVPTTKFRKLFCRNKFYQQWKFCPFPVGATTAAFMSHTIKPATEVQLIARIKRYACYIGTQNGRLHNWPCTRRQNFGPHFIQTSYTLWLLLCPSICRVFPSN